MWDLIRSFYKKCDRFFFQTRDRDRILDPMFKQGSRSNIFLNAGSRSDRRSYFLAETEIGSKIPIFWDRAMHCIIDIYTIKWSRESFKIHPINNTSGIMCPNAIFPKLEKWSRTGTKFQLNYSISGILCPNMIIRSSIYTK